MLPATASKFYPYVLFIQNFLQSSLSQLPNNTLTLPSAPREIEEAKGVSSILTLVLCNHRNLLMESTSSHMWKAAVMTEKINVSPKEILCTSSLWKAQLSDFSNYLRWGNPSCRTAHDAFSLAMCHNVYFSNDSCWIILSGHPQQKNRQQPAYNRNVT